MMLSRRHVLRVMAASFAVPLAALSLGQVQIGARPVVWRGTALGAVSSMTLWSTRPAHARRTLLRMHAELHRLETIFSLYRSDSELVRLNRTGYLQKPSLDALKVLELSLDIARLSKGAFDPTVQPLWSLYSSGESLDRRRIENACQLVDFNSVDLNRKMVGFARLGMQATLNGVAQGYITDRIADLLRNEGFENALVELGEIRALGRSPEGEPFPIGLVNPLMPTRLMQQVPLSEAALAVSGGYGHRMGDGRGHHILDPRTGTSASGLAQVAVIAPTAMLADALSTTIYVAGENKASGILEQFRTVQAILTRPDGSSVRF